MSRQRRHIGCCPTCTGTGATWDESTGGKCWDCCGTGHAHLPNEPRCETPLPAGSVFWITFGLTLIAGFILLVVLLT